ncbi:MAG: DUF1836 domain-containing protein [Clostridiales bacterium]|jgi:DNA-binding transcriptional MerR regulator|nr:DUF1836 domain-containing protein [Clostridiales bacterium]
MNETLRSIAVSHTRDPIRDLRNYNSEMSLSQVIKFFEKYDIHFTKTTVQHYIRIRILPPPAEKKYFRRHIALLAVIALLRDTFSLEEIRGLLAPVLDDFNSAENVYNTLADFLRAHLDKIYGQAPPEDSLAQKLELAAQAVAAKAAAVGAT